jgi:ribosomal protein L11 methylase PrmA
VLQRFVVPGGVLILSGFSGDDVEDIAEAFDATPQETLVEGEWAAMTIVN